RSVFVSRLAHKQVVVALGQPQARVTVLRRARRSRPLFWCRQAAVEEPISVAERVTADDQERAGLARVGNTRRVTQRFASLVESHHLALTEFVEDDRECFGLLLPPKVAMPRVGSDRNEQGAEACCELLVAADRAGVDSVVPGEYE